MEKNPLLLPGAIVVSGALIGAGLFFGLRGSSSVAAPSGSPFSVDPAAPPGSGASVPRSDPVSPPPDAQPGLPSTELQAKVQKQAQEALEKHRARIVQECWDPSFKKDPTPPRATFAFRFIFDAKGQAVVSGASALPDASRADVGACLGEMKLPISVPPPGVSVGVQLELTLPR
jgi:hypothetical protein